MPNLRELENAMPVAPLKIVALESARRLAEEVNDYMVGFRKSVNNKVKNDPAFHGYKEDSYLAHLIVPVLVPARQRLFFMNPSAARIYSFS